MAVTGYMKRVGKHQDVYIRPVGLWLCVRRPSIGPIKEMIQFVAYITRKDSKHTRKTLQKKKLQGENYQTILTPS